jgi:hypothetical protein
MEVIRKQPPIPFDGDSFEAFVLSDRQATPRNADEEAAVQYLTWALEAIERARSRKAAAHTRTAIVALRGANHGKDKDC